MNPVSPQLIKVRFAALALWSVIFLLAAIAWSVWGSCWPWAGLIALSIFVIWLAWLIPVQVRLLGWQETEDELLITKGRLWHKYTVVPYGRIQFVDITAGPIARAFGLKKIKIHTASASTDATISGLADATADALRDRLTIKARERMSGL
ncbi:MAG: PH domain-containing protein [Corynebacterium sp.]|nr:PH domain-containing protein [Corynebacterium sp.]